MADQHPSMPHPAYSPRDDSTDNPKFISATDVNRFCYCPWQWYYERLYGAATLRQMVKERNEALGITSSDYAQSAFAKGRAFHEDYLGRYAARRRRQLAVVLAAVLAGLAVAAGLLWMWLYYA